MALRNGGQFRLVRQIGIIIGKARDVDRCERGDVAQHMAGPDLVTTIRRKWNAMGKEQNLAHARPRAMNGPMRLATASGNFCHAAIFAL